MQLSVSKASRAVFGEVNIPGSKSESNRLLILQAIFPNLKIENLSTADDTLLLQKALKTLGKTVNIGHAGTAMRFLTAFFSVQKNTKITLTGSERMQERPIKILVGALRELGATINYEKQEGFPPLQIYGKELQGGKIALPANMSSQYISALMLIAPVLEHGLQIELQGNITSRPYLEMTILLLQKIGVEAFFENEKIRVAPKYKIENQTVQVEPDWSSASYYYSIAAFSSEAKIRLLGFPKNSLQGDAVVAEIYKNFGIKTTFEADSIVLEKFPQKLPKQLSLNLQNSPDLAQTIAVTCLGLGTGCHLSGLHTLKIKETDRISALKTEMEKLGAKVEITDDSLWFSEVKEIKSGVLIDTYQDHRMAMAFAPLGIFSEIKIVDYPVVSKSYPSFWEDLELLNFRLQKA